MSGAGYQGDYLRFCLAFAMYAMDYCARYAPWDTRLPVLIQRIEDLLRGTEAAAMVGKMSLFLRNYHARPCGMELSDAENDINDYREFLQSQEAREDDDLALALIEMRRAQAEEAKRLRDDMGLAPKDFPELWDEDELVPRDTEKPRDLDDFRRYVATDDPRPGNKVRLTWMKTRKPLYRSVQRLIECDRHWMLGRHLGLWFKRLGATDDSSFLMLVPYSFSVTSFIREAKQCLSARTGGIADNIGQAIDNGRGMDAPRNTIWDVFDVLVDAYNQSPFEADALSIGHDTAQSGVAVPADIIEAHESHKSEVPEEAWSTPPRNMKETAKLLNGMSVRKLQTLVKSNPGWRRGQGQSFQFDTRQPCFFPLKRI